MRSRRHASETSSCAAFFDIDVSSLLQVSPTQPSSQRHLPSRHSARRHSPSSTQVPCAWQLALSSHFLLQSLP